MLPAVGLGLLVLSAILIGGVYPAIIQQFVVKPNELAKESKYIAREIAATRQAYGVSGVKIISYQGASTESTGALAAQVANLPGMRLMDPAVVSQAFQQLQQVKGFYQFPPMLSVDRYPLSGGGQPQDLVVAVRGMGGPPQGQGNWINTHLVYTHGFGFVAAKANAMAADGTPAFVESDIPPRGELGKLPAARVLRRAAERVRDRRRAARSAAAGTRLPIPERRRPAELHLHRRRRRAGGLPAQPASCTRSSSAS